MGGARASDDHADLFRFRLFGGAFRRQIRREIRPHRRHRARHRARRGVERASVGAAEGAHLRRQFGDAGIAQRHRRGRCGAGFSSAGRQRRSGAARLRRCFGARATAARDRLSVDHRRLWRSRRRLGRRGNAAAAGFGAQPRAACGRASLAAISARAAASRSPSFASPAFTGPDKTRWCRSRAARPAASSSPARSSIASMSATSPRRSTPPSRAGVRDFQRRRRRAVAARPIRSSLPRSSWASRRRRKFVRRSRAVDVADGVEFLAGVPPRAGTTSSSANLASACAIRLIARD